jgi:hypothetical protein
MKYRTLLSAVMIISLLSAACSGKKDDSAAETTSTDNRAWKEMDEFHMVMAETFHPYKDSADLQPVKAKALELVVVADKWSNAPLPEKVDSDVMKTRLQTLKSETEVLADIVQNGEDNAIGEQLNKVHDLFHEIQETWYAGGAGHDHDHDH